MIKGTEYMNIVNDVVVYVAFKYDIISFQNVLDTVVKFYNPNTTTGLHSLAISKIAVAVWAALTEALDETDFLEEDYAKY